MKKYLALIVGVVFALSVSVYAVNLDDYMLEDGSYDMDGYYYVLACEKAAPFGGALDPSAYWVYNGSEVPEYYDYAAFTADYDALVASYAPSESVQVTPSDLETEEPLVEDDEGEPVPDLSTELYDITSDAPVSVVLEDNQFNTLVELVTPKNHQYIINDNLTPPPPTGTNILTFSYIDDEPLGETKRGDYLLISKVVPPIDALNTAYMNVTLRSGDTSYTTILDEINNYSGVITNDYVVGGSFIIVYNAPQTVTVDGIGGIRITVEENGIYVIGHGWNNYLGVESVEVVFPDFYGFPLTDGSEMIVGNSLKSIVTAIFGEYTPVYSTEIIRETVDDVTTTTLIDVVASGAAGIDYEWIAGVLVFCIVLFSFFRIVGVVFKR